MPTNVDPGNPDDDVSVYTAAEVDELLANLPGSPADSYTKAEVDAMLANLPAGDAYTKAEVDGLLASLPVAYTKAETDGLVTPLAAKSSVYTKTETNALVSPLVAKAVVYTKTEVDAKLDLKQDKAVTPPPPPPPPPGGNPIWRGNYSTGNFSQYLYVQNRMMNDVASKYPAGGIAPDNYLAQVVTDPVRGLVGRYEMRNGHGIVNDAGQGSGLERTEVMSTGNAGEGDLRFYQFAVKFDSTFPLNHADLGFGTVVQWHSGGGASPMTFVVNARNGYWTLTMERHNAQDQYIPPLIRVYETPLDRGNWHNMIVEVRWSANPTIGYVKVIRDGVQQTMMNGSQQYFVETLYQIPGDTVYYKEGYYRSAMAPTGIVYHDSAAYATSLANLPGFP